MKCAAFAILLALASVHKSWALSNANRVKFINGGYENVIVAIDKYAAANPPIPCSQFFANIEESFKESSRLLHEATEGRAFLRNVEIVVPATWDTVGCQRSVVKSPVVKEADFRVGPTHPLFGDRPWTRQSQGCWKPGDFVSLSAPFFAEKSNNSLRGLQLANQWARYRYGVFDDAFCAPGGICADGNHSARHDRLCGQLSPRRIILGHGDFNHSQSVTRTATNFTYTVHTLPKMIAAVDHSVGALDRDAWNYTRVALRMMLDYMEPEMEFGLIAYSNGSSETYEVLAKTKARNLDHMTPMSAVSRPVDGEPCLYCALERAVRLIESTGSSTTGHGVILITTGSAQWTPNVTILAQQKRLRISVIVVDWKSIDQVPSDLKSLAKDTDGHFAVVQFRNTPALDVQQNQFVNLSAIMDLEDALVDALTHHCKGLAIDLPVTIHRKMFAMGNRPLTGDKEERNGSFVLDERVKNAILRIYFSQTEHMYSVLGFAASNGTYTLPGKRYFPRDMRPWVYSWPHEELETCFTRPGNWSYKFYRRYPTVQPNYVRVIARLNSTGSKGPKVVLSIVPSNEPSSGHFLLLATVQYGHLPILNARVKASIRSLSNDSQSTEMGLADDGNDADINAADGVYTSRLEHFGQAAIVLTVDDNDEAAFTWRSTFRGSFECCHLIEVPNEGRELLPPFHLTVEKLLPYDKPKINASTTESTTISTTIQATVNVTSPATKSSTTQSRTTTAIRATTPSTISPTDPSTSALTTTLSTTSSVATTTPTSAVPSESTSLRPRIMETAERRPTSLAVTSSTTSIPSGISTEGRPASQVDTTQSTAQHSISPETAVTVKALSVHDLETTTQTPRQMANATAIASTATRLSNLITTELVSKAEYATAIFSSTTEIAKVTSTTEWHISKSATLNETAIEFTEPPARGSASSVDLVLMFLPFHVFFILLNYL